MTEFNELTQKFQGSHRLKDDDKAKANKILENALNIIARDGIRTVSMETVASESAITLENLLFYFKDINSLLTDAYIYFSVKDLEENKQLESLSTDALKTVNNSNEINTQLMLSPVVSVFIQEHIAHKTKDINSRYLEYAFINEALHNSDIAELMIISKSITLKMIESFFKKMGSNNSMADANITMACIRHLEYMLVVNKDITIDDPLINLTIRRLVDGLFSVRK